MRDREGEKEEGETERCIYIVPAAGGCNGNCASPSVNEHMHVCMVHDILSSTYTHNSSYYKYSLVLATS